MKGKILHLLWDEKITGRIIYTFENVFPGENDYIIWRNSNSVYKFDTPYSKCHIILNEANFPDLNFKKYNKIVIHGLDMNKVKLCKEKISKEIPIFWIVWGIELYNWLLGQRGFQLYYTGKKTIKKIIRNKIGIIHKRLGFNDNKDTKDLFEFIKKRNVKILCFEKEFKLIKKYYPQLSKTLTFVSDFFYYPIDEILGEELKECKTHGNNIIIGNSASRTNNHELVFEKLKNLNLKNRNIITPLNYNGTESYKDIILNKGNNYFGKYYRPIIEFLPLKEYNKLMTTASTYIYGNFRQEAFGNILVALYLGAKVYMSKRSPLKDHLKTKGFKFFILEEINQKKLDESLSIKDMITNRNIIKDIYNFNCQREIIKKIFK